MFQIRLVTIVYCLLLTVFFSCGDSRFPDFNKTKNGILYKLQDIGDGNNKAKPGDYITAQISIKSEKDSVLFDTRKIGLDGAVTFILFTPQYEKDYREGFQFLSSSFCNLRFTVSYPLSIP